MHLSFIIQLETKKVIFLHKDFLKNLFFQFMVQNWKLLIVFDIKSLRCVKRNFKNDSMIWFEIKSHQRRALHLQSNRNGRSKSGSGGGHHHLPPFIGLITMARYYKYSYETSLTYSYLLSPMKMRSLWEGRPTLNAASLLNSWNTVSAPIERHSWLQRHLE